MVLDLVVEAAEHPRQDRVARAEVDRRLDLVHRPDALLGRELLGRREVASSTQCASWNVVAVTRLDDHREREVGDRDDPPRVDEQRDHDRPADEHQLAADEPGEIPAARRPQRALADPAADERRDVADGLPAQHHQAVQRPDVEVLQPVPAARRLRRHETRERHLADVVVVAVDVRVRVVGDVVLDAPRVAAEPEQRVRAPAEQVIEAPRPEVGAVVRVVLDAEARSASSRARAGERRARPSATPGPDEDERRPRGDERPRTRRRPSRRAERGRARASAARRGRARPRGASRR